MATQLVQVYCPNCGNTRTYRVTDDRARSTRCNECLISQMEPIAQSALESSNYLTLPPHES